jgi:hypothetical protein
MFRDKYSHLPVPLHLIGSDSCEVFFSKIGGMVGLERAYDFHEVVGTAHTFNHLSGIDYGKNGLQFWKAHNKMENIWDKLHPLADGETALDLGDYSAIGSEDEVIEALKEGLCEAQRQLRILNMAPSSVARHQEWFNLPWLAEMKDPKSFAYTLTLTPELGEDDDLEVLRAVAKTTAAEEPGEASNESANNANVWDEVGEFDDGIHALEVAGNETRDALRDLMDDQDYIVPA